MAWTKPFMQTNIPKVTGGGRTMSDTTRPDDGTIDHIVEFSAHDDPIQDTIYILSKRDMDAIVAHIVELRTERARADRLAGALRAIANTEMESWRYDDLWAEVKRLARKALDSDDGGE